MVEEIRRDFFAILLEDFFAIFIYLSDSLVSNTRLVRHSISDSFEKQNKNLKPAAVLCLSCEWMRVLLVC